MLCCVVFSCAVFGMCSSLLLRCYVQLESCVFLPCSVSLFIPQSLQRYRFIQLSRTPITCSGDETSAWTWATRLCFPLRKNTAIQLAEIREGDKETMNKEEQIEKKGRKGWGRMVGWEIIEKEEWVRRWRRKKKGGYDEEQRDCLFILFIYFLHVFMPLFGTNCPRRIGITQFCSFGNI